MSTSQEVIIRYLEDAEAAEQNSTDTFAMFGRSGEQLEVRHFFDFASKRAKTQQQRLESRLRTLGGSASTAKSILAHVLTFTPTLAQLGHEGVEKNTQHLIMSIAAASASLAMYEALATVASAVGDTLTEALAQELKNEEKDDYAMAWKLLKPSAVAAFQTVIERHAPGDLR